MPTTYRPWTEWDDFNGDIRDARFPILNRDAVANDDKNQLIPYRELAQRITGNVQNVIDHADYNPPANYDWTAALQSAVMEAAGPWDTFQGGTIMMPARRDEYVVEGTFHVRENGMRVVGTGGMYHGTRIQFEPGSDAWVCPHTGLKVCINFQDTWSFLGNRFPTTGTAQSGTTTELTDTALPDSPTIQPGAVIVNRTTNAWGQVTSATGTTVTHTALVGGTRNNWLAGDAYDIGYPSMNRGGELSHIQILTRDTPLEEKMAIRLWDCGETNVFKVNVRDMDGPNSIGIATFGRQHIMIEDSEIYATRPAVIGRIADPDLQGVNSYDNSFFRNVQLACLPDAPVNTDYPWVGLHLTGDAEHQRSCFRDMNIRGGHYAVYKNTPVGQIDQGFSANIYFDNVHWEQPAAGAICNWYINFEASGAFGLTLRNCGIRTAQSSGDGLTLVGVHVKGVRTVILEGCYNGMGNPQGPSPIIKIDGGVEELIWNGMQVHENDTWENNQADLHCVREEYDQVNSIGTVQSKMPSSGHYKRNWIGNVGSDRTVTYSDNGRTFTNKGAVGLINFPLPDATINQQCKVTFVRHNAHPVRVIPFTGQRVGSGNVDQYLQIDTDRTSVTLSKEADSDFWILDSAGGAVSYA